MSSVYEVPAIGASLLFAAFALVVATDSLGQSNYIGGAVAATSAVGTVWIAALESELLSLLLVRYGGG